MAEDVRVIIAALQETTRMGTQEGEWGINFPELTGILLGCVTLLFAILSWLSSRRSVRVSQEQLKLAHEQAEMRPKLRVSDIRLAELSEAQMYEYVERFRKVRKQIELWERTKEKREERKRQQEQELLPEVRRLQAETERLMSQSISRSPPPANPIPYSERPEGYEGPIPDKLLEITVANEGKAAAYEVTGWLSLEASHLESAPFFSRGANARASSLEDGFYTVRVGGTEHSTLMPTRKARLRFWVAVAVHSPGTTQIEYEFTTPVGAGDKDYKWLDIPALE